MKLEVITFHQNIFTHFSREHPSITLSDLSYAPSLEAVPVVSVSLDELTVQGLGSTGLTGVNTGEEESERKGDKVCKPCRLQGGENSVSPHTAVKMSGKQMCLAQLFRVSSYPKIFDCRL